MMKSNWSKANVPGKTDESTSAEPHQPEGVSGLASYPPPEQWDDWTEYDSTAWPKKVERKYVLVPTICFNCEAACGLLAYVDKETLEVRKFEGNPYHPASRGRNCAKAPAIINQVNDPERILYPLRRAGKRGEGKWERTTWDEVLDTFAGRIRSALREGRRGEVMYHVGRPGHDGYMDRVLQAWGIDGHNSHTNVCSSSARVGFAFWTGSDRPSPDFANARFVLLISSHLEAGHYFNPHAQRIVEAKRRGSKIAVMDPRLSNTASMADYWLPTWPGTETAALLAVARILLDEDIYDREFVRRWTNWEEYLRSQHPEDEVTFDNFIRRLKELYVEFTPEFAERESGITTGTLVEIAHEIARAGSAFSAHVWRSAATGNLGGWQVARAVMLLNVLTGSVGTPGGTSPNTWDKFVPVPPQKPPAQNEWNELSWPLEYPLSFHELSFLLPHFLKEGRGKLDVYFTRVYNPIWANPDGATWYEVLRDESLIGLHAALTPTWSETAWFADYILPMGLSSERHDLMSQETQAAKWLGFRQPVRRVAMEKLGKKVAFTYEANPGEVWEEDEFWIELSWRIDPDGSLGIRRYFESPYRPGEKITIDEYYSWIFERSVPGLPDDAARESMTPLGYMRKYGAFLVEDKTYRLQEKIVSARELDGAEVDQVTGLIKQGGQAVGVEVDGNAFVGFPTPSRKLEFFSSTLADWGWPEYAVPNYIRSHVHWSRIDREKSEYLLLPTFRLPMLIHTRSGNAKWLNEIAHRNPLWMHPSNASDLCLVGDDLIRVNTEIGYFIARVWLTEAIRPGIVACSHHLGRWRLHEELGNDRWSSALVEIVEQGAGKFLIRQKHGVAPFKSDDPDSARIWWEDAGVHQNFAFPVHPDPVSGMHCWHQKVTLEHPRPGDRYGDSFADTALAQQVYRQWLSMTRPGPESYGLRRPLWLARTLKPSSEAYRVKGKV